jgi:multicomponent K+:H+ antiporter subunit A
MMLAFAVGLPFLAALLLFALPNGARNLAAALAGGITLLALAALASQLPGVFAGEVVEIGWAWLPFAGADFGFRADGLALVFALLVVAIGALVILYARYYLDAADPIARFYAFFMLFMGAMLGLVLAGNLLLLAVFWEMTSLASFLLIGYWQHRADARQGARMALVVTGAGGLCLLGGVLLLGRMAGSFDLDVVLAAGDVIRAHPAYLPMLALVLVGAFAKSAQFPLHFWLPQAMAAPTPVSAYLHSATMVKAGVFLLARLHPAIAGTDAWFYLVTTTGLATLVVGAWTAVYQHDLKGLLAWSTISHLGLITLLLGLDTPLASVAAVFHILNHATFKASLFMAAGIIDHECGTRDMRRINGLWKYMPVTAVLAIVAAAAMAGVPLMNGFLSKEMFFAETLELGDHGVYRYAVPLLATLAAAFSVAYSTRFIHDVFWNGEPRGLPKKPHEPPFWMIVPCALLALLCLLVGVLPAASIGAVLAVAAGSVVGGPLPAYSLAIWHGLNLPLLMSVVALAVGAGFYFSLQRIFRLHEHVHLPRGGKEMFDALLGGVLDAARAITGAVVDGRLQRLLGLALVTAVVAVGWPLLARDGLLPDAGGGAESLPPLALLVWVLGVAGVAGTVVWHRRRFVAMLFVGLTGLVVSLVFALLSAPDVALTQLLVEVASVLLVMLALYFLPAHSPPEPQRARRWRDAALAGVAGLGIATLAYAVLLRPPLQSIAPWYLANALPGAAGANAVNVIIVDFRGLDTLGEIAVLGIAALLVSALLAGLGSLEVGAGAAGSARRRAPQRPPERPLLLETVGPVLLPLATVVAIWFFVRGHNDPGGGFIGGLILALGLLVPYLGRGTDWVESRARLDLHRWIGGGLAIATLAGLASFAAGHPFLTSHYFKGTLPGLGATSLASAVFFDFGVFAAVAGATLLALTTLGRLEGRSVAPAVALPDAGGRG